jgi:hypothetical protein
MKDDWTGPKDGPFRGQHLIHCTRHPTIWRASVDLCPVCRLESDVARLRAAADRRCEECRKKGGHDEA